MQAPRVACPQRLTGALQACWRPCVGRPQQAAVDGRHRLRCSAASAMAPGQQASTTAKHPAWVSTPIILGSESASRRGIMDELAQQFGFSYSTVAADIDEKAIRNDDPAELVLSLAHAKAMAIGARWERDGTMPPEGLLITCDQVVLCDDVVLEKPENEEQARQYIRGYSDSSAQTLGAVRVTDLASGRSVAATDTCEVHFGEIPESVVDALVADKTTYGCAGGLMVEHPLVSPIIEDQFGEKDALMGLSKELLLELLHKAALFRPAPKHDADEIAKAARGPAPFDVPSRLPLN